MKVIVDADRCIGSGQCVRSVPGVFDQSEGDGSVVLLEAHPAASLEEAIRRAARRCPAQAITLHDEGSDHAA